MARTSLAQHVDHVAEELVVASLVGGDRNGIRIFLKRGPHYVLDRTIVAQVDHFSALRLNQPAHHVDGSVVPIEE